MKIARFWAREVESFPWGKGQGETGCWGWSSESLEAARQNSREVTRRLIARLVQDDPNLPYRGPRDEYGYPNRPPREEIVQEFHDARGEPAAVITRNAYGALVLNTRDLGFFDVDLPPPPRLSAGNAVAAVDKLVGRLFGRSAPPSEPTLSPEEVLLERIRAWAASHARVSLRVYRTASGFRCLVTDRPLDAVGDEATAILNELECDPLYVRLCRLQECFRARLTPKPWRIGHRAPPNRFPWSDASAEATYRKWQTEYEKASQQYATCRLAEQHGPGAIHTELAPLVELHDELTRCAADAPLA